jgi:heme/copper-type cytochrome/quinol oxidase subunit 1
VTGQFFGADPEDVSASNRTYNRLFTLHGAIMVFMFIVPSHPGEPGQLLPARSCSARRTSRSRV